MNYSFDVLTQIDSVRNQFSVAEEKLAAYVLNDPSRVVNQSITDLAEASGVSVSSVSRFCRRLSLNGYQDFRLELMRSLTNIGSSEITDSGEINPNDSISAMVSKMTTVYSQAFSKTAAGIEMDAFERVCNMIDEAEDVHFVATGTMLPIALAAKLQFMYVSKKFHCELDPASQALSTSQMDAHSLVIVFAYTGETIDAVEVARFAKENGAKVVAITRYSQSSLADLANEILICSVSKSVHQHSSLPLSAGFQFIADLLYTEYCRRHPEDCMQNKQKTIGVVVGKLK